VEFAQVADLPIDHLPPEEVEALLLKANLQDRLKAVDMWKF
jgi:hypothetical protein